MNVDRITGGLLFLFALAYTAETFRMRVGMTSDPLGPKAYPLLLAGALSIAALCLMLRRRQVIKVAWPEPGMMLILGGIIASFFVYSFLLIPLGFVVTTILQLMLLCLLYGAPFRKSAPAAFCLSLGIYLLFDKALGIPLPSGQLFGA